MATTLIEVSGIPHAIAALKESRRHYDINEHLHDMALFRKHSDYRGFLDLTKRKPDDETWDAAGWNSENDNILHALNILSKWGAGVGQKEYGAWYDSGHETILRFIDFTFVTTNLHRGATDDLDSHACRFNNRIIRSSTRLSTYNNNERTPWYQDKIKSTEEVADAAGYILPQEITIGGIKWTKAANGYVRSDLTNDHDVARGNYPLSIPVSAIWKINLVDARHVYMRRNQYTNASPELRINIESLADQIEKAIPGNLGKLVRYDYAFNPNTNDYEMTHIMNIKKVVDTTRTENDR